MFDKIFLTKRIYGYFVITALFIVGTVINFWTHQFLGGIFIMVVIMSALLLSKRGSVIIILFIYALSLSTDISTRVPIRPFLLKQVVFMTTTGFAFYTGIEIKKYIYQLTRRREEIARFNKDVVMAFVNTIDAKDQYLCGHSLNVAFYAKQIANQMNLSPVECNQICLAGIFHDIGKIGVSEGVLNKPGHLDEEEWKQIKKHPAIGSDIISNVAALQDISEIIRYHHLHFNGKGYPAGPSRDEIPLGARIIAVADAFDAMTSNRSYRSARSVDEACQEMLRCSGTQFDPAVVEAFLKCPVIRTPRMPNPNDVLEEAFDLLYTC